MEELVVVIVKTVVLYTKVRYQDRCDQAVRENLQ